MSTTQNIKRLFKLDIEPDVLRQLVLPAGADVVLTANAAGSTYGAWVDVAAAGTVTVPTLVVGVILTTHSAIDVFTVDIGSCAGYTNAAALNAVPAAIIAAHRAEVRAWGYTSGAGGGAATDAIVRNINGWIPLAKPVLIPALTGILGRCYGITAAAVTIRCSVVCLQGF